MLKSKPTNTPMLWVFFWLRCCHNAQIADGTHQTSTKWLLTLRICPPADQIRIRKDRQNLTYNNKLREIWNFHRFLYIIQAFVDDRRCNWFRSSTCTRSNIGISYFVWKLSIEICLNPEQVKTFDYLTMRNTSSTYVGNSTVPLRTIQIWIFSI